MTNLKKEINRVLLVEPPLTRPPDMPAEKVRIGVVPPLGLAYIAAVLEKEGYEVKILDCIVEGSLKGSPYRNGEIRYGLSDDDIKARIREFSPHIVGVSCLTSNKYKDAHNVCRLAKEIDQSIPTVMGGTHPTVLPEATLADANVDFVVLGEGEYTARDLLHTLATGDDLAGLDGIGYKDHDEIRIIPKTRYIENLDELPFPARHLLRMDRYSTTVSPHSGIKRTPFTAMISSRGCPARCTFCTIRKVWGPAHRMRSAGNVLAEIEHLVRDYGIKEIHFEDDNLTTNKQRALGIFNGLIQRKLDITCNSPSGLALFTLDEELLRKMKECGYYSISIAIESGDADVLKKLMHKPVNLDKARRIAKITRDLDLKVKGFFILGYPGETKEQMKRTVDFAASLDLDWAIFFIATPLPGTELEAICQKNDYLIHKNLDYVRSFFVSNIKTPEFTPEYVGKLREEANFNVNFKNNTNLRLGKYDRAIADFSEVIALYPNLDFAHFYLGVAYEKKGLPDKAIEEWKKTLAINPDYVEAREKLKEYGKERK